ncbi:MAG: ATP-binding protein [Firmicutes bacterium]|nr:ATP-binding protein [Bacillota bacterium]
MYINRSLESKFKEMDGFFKAVLVTGARQVGKTTMLKHLSSGQNRAYVTLDDEQARTLARTDPKLFFMRYKPPILIDEVQKAPELFSQIKILCDENDKTGLFWLTGSEQFSMMKNITESLAGRVGILNLYPLSYNEINNVSFETALDFSLDALIAREKQAASFDLNTIFDFIWKGGMPQVLNANNAQRETFYNSYINTYIMRDVTNNGAVTDFSKFTKFLTACAANVSQQLNLTNLANATEISVPTAKTWLDLLQRLHIVFLLAPYSNNKFKRLTKTPKLYFWDSGLCAYLTRWLTKDTLLNGRDCGAYFENFVVTELIKDLHYSSVAYDLSYFRDSNSKEIDLILEKDGQVHPLEIKLSAAPDRREVKKYELLDKYSVPRGNGGIICMSPNVIPLNEKDCYIPINIL